MRVVVRPFKTAKKILMKDSAIVPRKTGKTLLVKKHQFKALKIKHQFKALKVVSLNLKKVQRQTIVKKIRIRR